MHIPGQYHAGELAAQRQAGLLEQAELTRQGIGARVPPPAAEFLSELPVLFVGAADQDQRMWASLLTGPPGFLRAVGDGLVEVAARPSPADPLATVLAGPAQLGTLAIDPATRRRMRLNGRSSPTTAVLTIAAEQVCANCPKYIQQRRPHHRAAAAIGPATASSITARMSAGQQALISAADTFFIATHARSGDADVSHRGGRPGFVQVTSDNDLRWPDYVGNAMMMTLGNLHQVAEAGLLFLDWRTGTTLQLTGTATVDFDPTAVADMPGAQRAVRFHVTAAVQIEQASPLIWSPPVLSKFNPPVAAAPLDPAAAAGAAPRTR